MSHAANNYVKHLKVAPNGEKITPSEKAVLGQLADDHHEDAKVAWPSLSALAARACMTTRHCRRIMRELERKGVIETMPNTREKDGGQTSNECRFCQIDPPFNAADKATLSRRLQLQKVQRVRGPVQERLFKGNVPPSDTDVRGGRTPMSGGGGHREPGGADTDVRGGRTPMSAQDSLNETLKTLQGEASQDIKDIPLPPSGAKKKGETDQTRWLRMQLSLKSDLKSISAKLAADKNFTEIEPGRDDYESCFRAWWLEDVKRLPNGLLLTTMAGDEDATEAGLTKYKARVERLTRQFFDWPKHKPVTFKVLREPRERPAKKLADLVSPRDEWERLKAEIEYRLNTLPRAQATEAKNNYQNAVRPTKLLRIEMDGAQPVWTVYAVNPKKTMAVLGLLRRVVAPAIRSVAGCEVQIVATEQLGA